MLPNLLVITGPLKSKAIELSNVETYIGRDMSNAVALNDLSVSRQHCVIKMEGKVFTIFDLNSHNGTFVNGIPINERALKTGDKIEVGKSLFVFHSSLDEGNLDETTENYQSSLIELTSEEIVTKTSIRMSVEDALISMSRELSVFLKIGTVISSINDSERLIYEILERIFDIVPAERGAILLLDEMKNISSFGMYRNCENQRNFHVSGSLAQQILNEGVSILSNNIVQNDTLRKSDSLIASKIRSLLCAPLILAEKVIGLIYLDSSDITTRFEKDHLQLITAIANLSAGVLENVRRIESLQIENKLLRFDSEISHSMIGESLAMREVYNLIAKMAQAESNVLITGESGTGKELAARAIHRNGPRANKPFVAINCAAITETLLESEIFGHEKGSFTGATSQKKGRLEISQGGTVFLDEIGEMSPSLQAKLLRVLQEREFERVGGTQTIKADVRFIAATNRDVEKAINQSIFRQDLYYRLKVLELRMPALRERREDISLLVSYFTARYSDKCKRPVMGVSSAARKHLIAYDWPGNVRELENTIERAVVLSTTNLILPEDLPEVLLERRSESVEDSPLNIHRATKEAKRKCVMEALAAADNDYLAAAKMLGIHPNNLHRLIRNLDLKTRMKRTEKQP